MAVIFNKVIGVLSKWCFVLSAGLVKVLASIQHPPHSPQSLSKPPDCHINRRQLLAEDEPVVLQVLWVLPSGSHDVKEQHRRGLGSTAA